MSMYRKYKMKLDDNLLCPYSAYSNLVWWRKAKSGNVVIGGE